MIHLKYIGSSGSVCICCSGDSSLHPLVHGNERLRAHPDGQGQEGEWSSLGPPSSLHHQCPSGFAWWTLGLRCTPEGNRSPLCSHNEDQRPGKTLRGQRSTCDVIDGVHFGRPVRSFGSFSNTCPSPCHLRCLSLHGCHFVSGPHIFGQAFFSHFFLSIS